MSQAYRGQTYYGRSQLKPSPFGFMVSLYIYLAGLSGSAQMLATIGDLFGGRAARGMVRRGRLLAMLGTVAGPALLIADLHTPQRFYNMLRILRTTSPMSIGSYILTSFGLTSTLTAAAQLLADRIGGRAGMLAARGRPGGVGAGRGHGRRAERVHGGAAIGDEHAVLGRIAALARGALRRFVHCDGGGGPVAPRTWARRCRASRGGSTVWRSARWPWSWSRAPARTRISGAPASRRRWRAAPWNALERGGVVGLGTLLPIGLFGAEPAARRAGAGGVPHRLARDARGRACAAARPHAGGQRVGQASRRELRAGAAAESARNARLGPSDQRERRRQRIRDREILHALCR